jgi:hypothetical protein
MTIPQSSLSKISILSSQLPDIASPEAVVEYSDSGKCTEDPSSIGLSVSADTA